MKTNIWPREWCLFKNCLNNRREPLKAAAQIRKPGGNPDPCSGLQLDHRNGLPKTVRTGSGATPGSTLITARAGNLIWIDPDGPMTGAISALGTPPGSAVTVTGTSLVWPLLANTESSLRYCTAAETWFAFTPCSRATRDRCSRDKRRFYNPTHLFRCPLQPSP